MSGNSCTSEQFQGIYKRTRDKFLAYNETTNENLVWQFAFYQFDLAVFGVLPTWISA